MKLTFSPQSVSDLERLKDFIAINNPRAASKIAELIIQNIKLLLEQPKVGLPVPGTPNEAMRDLYVKQYTIRYLAGAKEIIILRIWHNKESEKDQI
ncbi:MAG: type II toxin-antitoxin system RelE/ParE family toxin [Endozoicomonas sp.]|uniref:type II toxin-antitoxin system RelE/ParE family toxin n=1 Tax=Endozoicomonas sp. TaxID=1892382 RepID=UPI003D9B20DA